MVHRSARVLILFVVLMLVCTACAMTRHDALLVVSPATPSVVGSTPAPARATPSVRTPTPTATAHLPPTPMVLPATARPVPTPSSVPIDSTAQQVVRVYFIDVGQSDSIFIQAPDGATVLIDGGSDARTALGYLHAHGVARVDALIVSHPHAGHIGGLVAVLCALPVGGVWTSGASHTTGIFEQFVDAIADTKMLYHEVTRGNTIAVGLLRVGVLRSGPHAPTSTTRRWCCASNIYGTVSFLFTGDAKRASEAALLADDPARLASTMLRVGHHGSSTSSSPAFLAAVQPQVAVYSAGAHNSYGHPHASTIAALQAAGADMYGTPTHGTVVISTNGQQYHITTAKDTGGASSPAPVTAPLAVPPATVPPPAVPPPSLRYDPQGPDRDCGDFATHADAQALFVAAGGPAADPHGLDNDGDGSACESLP